MDDLNIGDNVNIKKLSNELNAFTLTIQDDLKLKDTALWAYKAMLSYKTPPLFEEDIDSFLKVLKSFIEMIGQEGGMEKLDQMIAEDLQLIKEETDLKI